ncbi:hypothetical protein CPB83DRAFT_864553 [Crepidotus variabilis]|uniref:DUF6534 domain-containing protein n=1 Tax=Crepidotus variabilis TaxID=179855 RepID=A0A9P6E4P0_9AGAR|nr:hypothetical protein CPB83DRAFT_864553 [Crepidotus variabilis]
MSAVDQRSINGNHGSLLLALTLSALLYGIASAQSIIYFHQWTKDRPLFKKVVTVLWILNTVQLLLMASSLYNWLITHYGDFTALGKPSATSLAQMYVSGVSDIIVRSFFARRAFILLEGRRRRRPFMAWGLASLIVGVAIFVFMTSTAYSTVIYRIQGRPIDQQLALITKIAWVQYTFNIASGVVDIIIAVSLSVILAKNRTGFKATDNIVVHLMIFSISSGLVTSAVALSAMVVYATLPMYLISLGLNWIISQLHFNSLLLSLNARTALRERHGEPNTHSDTFSHSHEGISVSGRPSTRYSIPLRETRAQISISKEVTVSDSL